MLTEYNPSLRYETLKKLLASSGIENPDLRKLIEREITEYDVKIAFGMGRHQVSFLSRLLHPIAKHYYTFQVKMKARQAAKIMRNLRKQILKRYGVDIQPILEKKTLK